MNYDENDFQRYADYADASAFKADKISGVPNHSSTGKSGSKKTGGKQVIDQVGRKVREDFTRGDVCLIAVEVVEIIAAISMERKPKDAYAEAFWTRARHEKMGWRRLKMGERARPYMLVHVDDAKWVYHFLDFKQGRNLWTMQMKPWQKSYIKNQVATLNDAIQHGPVKAPEGADRVEGTAGTFGPIWWAVERDNELDAKFPYKRGFKPKEDKAKPGPKKIELKDTAAGRAKNTRLEKLRKSGKAAATLFMMLKRQGQGDLELTAAQLRKMKITVEPEMLRQLRMNCEVSVRMTKGTKKLARVILRLPERSTDDRAIVQNLVQVFASLWRKASDGGRLELQLGVEQLGQITGALDYWERAVDGLHAKGVSVEAFYDTRGRLHSIWLSGLGAKSRKFARNEPERPLNEN